jgi:UDP-2-acetamido-2,6-beta-L-arabino-hexul-4-ose reductase
MKVAVIGAAGFIGRKLVKSLKSSGYIVFEITRQSTSEEFSTFLLNCDFCFHLAGEVRPNASENDFYENNVLYTKRVLEYLMINDAKPPIFFSSTVHAESRQSPYGNTKYLAEMLIHDYNCNTANVDLIYRLTHLFGCGAKPYHNSVFTTWIYDALCNKELIVYNESHVMHYIHVDELVSSMINILRSRSRLVLPQTYNISLGDLKSKILYIKNGGVPLGKLDIYIMEMLEEARQLCFEK